MAIAVPIAEGLEALIMRGLLALGVGTVAHKAVKVIPQSRAKDCADAADESQCNQCRLQEGQLGQAAQPRFITARNRLNYDYQLYIANLKAGPERFYYVAYGDNTNTEINLSWGLAKNAFGTGGKYSTVEWRYMGVWFDGFWREVCTVVEAKGNYEGMFGDNIGGDAPWATGMLRSWLADLSRQEAAVAAAAPQGKLEWHFMQRLPYARAVNAGLPAVIARLTPMPLGGL